MRLIIVLLVFISNALAGTNTYDVSTYIPKKAFPLLPVVKNEIIKMEDSFAKDVNVRETVIPYIGSLIEHESCISLTHKRCWDPTSQLSTSRELGVGLGMITKAYKADGSVRFDKLKELQQRYNKDLKELSWLTIKERPDLQIRAIVFMFRENMNTFFMVKDPVQRMKMADVAYNAGPGSVKKDRIYCGLRPNCDPQIWEGNVETNSQVSRKPIYGNRSAYDISRNHVHDTTVIRLPKYQRFFFVDPSKYQ